MLIQDHILLQQSRPTVRHCEAVTENSVTYRRKKTHTHTCDGMLNFWTKDLCPMKSLHWMFSWNGAVVCLQRVESTFKASWQPSRRLHAASSCSFPSSRTSDSVYFPPAAQNPSTSKLLHFFLCCFYFSSLFFFFFFSEVQVLSFASRQHGPNRFLFSPIDAFRGLI